MPEESTVDGPNPFQEIEDRHLSSRSRQTQSGGSSDSSGGGGAISGSSSDAEVADAVDAQADAEGGIDAAQLAHLYERATAPTASAVPSAEG